MKVTSSLGFWRFTTLNTNFPEEPKLQAQIVKLPQNDLRRLFLNTQHCILIGVFNDEYDVSKRRDSMRDGVKP